MHKISSKSLKTQDKANKKRILTRENRIQIWPWGRKEFSRSKKWSIQSDLDKHGLIWSLPVMLPYIIQFSVASMTAGSPVFFEFYSPRTIYKKPRAFWLVSKYLSSYYFSFLNPKLRVPPWGQRIPQNGPDAVTLRNVLLLLCGPKCLVHCLLKPEQTEGMPWPAQAVVTQRPSALSLPLLTLNLRVAVYWPRPT